MYEMIKQVIQTRTYRDSNALIAKIQRLYIEGTLTEGQYTELRSLLVESEAVKTYDVEAEIDRIWVELRALRALIESSEGGEEPEPPAEEIPDFVQPTGAQDAYQTGDKVRYNGKIYESLIDGNVWAPDVYPAGWKEVPESVPDDPEPETPEQTEGE